MLEQLAGTRGLARARLEPRSDVIQLVTYDGEHIGHVRREGPTGPEERWVAVLRHQARQVGTYGSAGRCRCRAGPGLRQDDQEDGLKCLRDTTSRGLPR